MSGITIKDVQTKLLRKLEQNQKAEVSEHLLTRIFRNYAGSDGCLTEESFAAALRDKFGSVLDGNETSFLFYFWDSMAGQREPSGLVEYQLIVADLTGAMPQYTTGFNSGNEAVKTNKGAKANRSSQEGGIFGGGSYEADANGVAPPNARAPAPPMMAPPQMMAAPSSRPKGNQSSIPGGIFGGEAEAAVSPRGRPVPPQSGGNKSNKSSIEGGIFGTAPPAAPVARGGRNSNQSSIPGGIFG